MEIRKATIDDIDILSELENTCFPPAEAATRAQFETRLRYYGSHFYLLFVDGKLVSFIDGFVTDEENLRDEMYDRAEMHNEKGAWQMLFGVNTHPDYRKKGYAGLLIKEMIEDARRQGRKGLVLTCKDALVHYYAAFGFSNEGVSTESTHGGVVWNQMRLTF